MFIQKLIKVQYFIYCELINAIIIYSEEIQNFDETNISVTLSVYCIENKINVIGFDSSFEEVKYFRKNDPSKLTDENIIKVFTFIIENDYLKKFNEIYKTILTPHSLTQNKLITGKFKPLSKST